MTNYSCQIKVFISYWVLGGILLLYGCNETHDQLDIILLEGHSVNGGEPNLHLSANNTLFQSWIEYDTDQVSLQFAKLEEGEWSAPMHIATGNNWFVNWADFPSISSYADNDKHLVAHWLQKSDVGTFDYDVRVSQSSDGGASWQSSFVIHDDGIAAEHGFVSLLPVGPDRMMATWLDGRNTKGEKDTSDDHGHGHHGSMTLRAAEFDINGTKYYDDELDSRICDCCQTGAAMSSCGPVVVYRDRSDHEIRDIYIIRREGDGWTAPHAVHHDGWNINGCPVNGPAVVASRESVAVAWFTMADDSPRVNVAFSDDCGDNFTLLVRVDNGDPLGRVDLVLHNEDEVLVSWIESVEEGAEIMMAKVSRDKGLLDKWSIITTDNARRSGFPRIEKYEDDVILAWTSVKDSTTFVQTAKINL